MEDNEMKVRKYGHEPAQTSSQAIEGEAVIGLLSVVPRLYL